MKLHNAFRLILAGIAASALSYAVIPNGAPSAVIDLATAEGAHAVNGQWRFSPVKIVETEFRSPGADGQPTGPLVKTYDYLPKAGASGFDDSGWEAIGATTLAQHRSTGRLCFAWYRINVTVPPRVGGFDTAGSTVVFETAVDDYAEIWVDGELTRALGQSGGSVVSGWNAPNRLVVGRDVRPGQKIQIAVFGMNGPISSPPTNFIWLRYAKLEFHRAAGPGPVSISPREVNVDVVRRDPAFDAIVGPNPKLYKLAEGFQFTEGPVWSNDDGGYLLFSDPNSNTIYRYTPTGAGDLTVFRTPSGYDGPDIATYGQPGSNGLTYDPQGRLTINEHGNRRVVRLENDGAVTVLAERFEGKRLNSPNDLVYRSDGTLFFTDPPFGLPRFFEDPRKELPFSGVFSVYRGKLQLLSKDFTGPNGIALSPNEKTLYVANWDDHRKVIMSYPVKADATLGAGKLFFDMTSTPGEDALDGMKVDQRGNLYVSGPGGLWVLSPDGRHLGTIITPHHAHNFAWGGEDGKTLYICARTSLYRIALGNAGVRP